ncbi:nitrite reductase large subunit NirB [Patulibacter sp. SYSU D01012]|uniref:nitrite reductase large subunit NirB n=1 Tax=Patulibacter sp. SYSU D01012 TaxID=2817381 RepID=UPI001B30813F|nr:nitrite reductase large subunit NirB [Patulibacter sp. SYSU D01012]
MTLPIHRTDVLVVGGGIAGQAVCEALRARTADLSIALVCEEPRLPFDRVSLSHLLVDGKDPEALQLRPDDWYADHRVDLFVGDAVEALDLDGGRARLASGIAVVFGRVVLCTGSEPLMPPLPGIDLPGVIPFRGPEDCQAIRDAAAVGTEVAVIGGGLLGLEAAYGVATQGAPATVVHLMDRLMERQLDDPAAALLEPALAGLGVTVLLERQTAAILGTDRAEGLRFADGEELACGLVVVSIGIRARTALASAAGLTCERGIVVDDAMVASHPRALAVGECAEHRGQVYGIVAPIHEQAEVAAETLLRLDAAGATMDVEDGELPAGARYDGSILSAKLKVLGVDVVSIGDAVARPGDPAPPTSVATSDPAAGVYRKLVVRDGVVTGAILVGDVRGHELLLDGVRTGRATDDPLALLAEASQASPADLPDAAQVCNCNGVCKGEIVRAIQEHDLGSTQEVVATTRAGAGCGSCKPTVTEILKVVRGGQVDEATYLCPCRRQTREDLAAVAREQGVTSVSELSAACGAGRECGACKPGLAYLVSELNDNRHREERHARFINDRVHGNIQKDGTFSVVPRMRGGVTTPSELRRIADVAERFDVPCVKVTGGQRIDLLGIRKEDLPAVWEALDMPSGYAYAKSVRTVKTCVGAEFCRFGLGDSMNAGIELEQMIEGLYTPHKVKLAVSGCPRNCAESLIKDIGLVAIEGGWEVSVGGSGAGTVRQTQLLARVDTKDRALDVAIVFLQYYREHGEYLERTAPFVDRVGLETIKAAVLDEASGEPDRLRERFRIAKAACDPDPWRERRAPAVPRQFAELDSEATPIGPPPGGAPPAVAAVEGERAGGPGGVLSIQRVLGAPTRKATDA